MTEQDAVLSIQSRRAPNGRLTIGFLLASLHSGASRVLWPGLLDAAERHDINLICFPGGRLHASESFETQRNVIFDLAGKDCLDGLVSWSSSLGGVLGPGEVNAFHRRYQALPLVSLAQLTEGTPTVSIDSYQGMRALLKHLIEEHGYRRLAFIRGPEGHYYAQERYRAYLDTLQAYHLPFVPELVTPPLRWEAGAEAVQTLLDKHGLRPGVDFQALVAVSDLLALWALKTLQARGFQVPGDVAVTGFNGSIEGQMAAPALTTVNLPFYDQGAKSVETLVAQCAGEPVPALITLPSKLIVRRSCGCPSAAVAQAASLPLDALGLRVPVESETAASLARAACLLEMAAAAGMDAEKSTTWIVPVLDAFLIDLQSITSGAAPGRFLPALDEALDRIMRANQEIASWHGVLSALRRWALPALALPVRASVEVLIAQARVMVSEAIQRSQAYWQWQAERQAESLRDIGRTLLTTFDVEQLSNVLAERLPSLGIPSAYLALYENPATSLENARLVLAYTEQGRPVLEGGGQRFAAHHLVPADLLPHHRRYSLVVEPLYFQEKPLGFIVFEIGPRDGDVYELLRGNLSSALQGAHLFHEIQQARLVAEKADRVKTRLLANVSHELRTPLNIILGYTQDALQQPTRYNQELPPSLLNDLQHIQHNAEHQLRVINDLLDLSRAEIDELDLHLELLDPRPLLMEAFHSLADQANSPDLTWRLALPERLPLIRADALRLRQIFLNLLSNADKFTRQGQITLGAEITPPEMHFWVADTGAGIPPEQQERIFEPFVTAERGRSVTSSNSAAGQRPSGGIGLGLSITRHLVALHGGRLMLESQSGKGSTFHVYIPLPALGQVRPTVSGNAPPVLLLISTADQPVPELLELSRRQGLEIRLMRSGDDPGAVLANTQPMALAWDLAGALPGDWALVRSLRHYPSLYQAPFILYGQFHPAGTPEPALTAGLTSFVIKSADGQTLLDTLTALCPVQTTGPILIVDDDPQVRDAHQALVMEGFPGYTTRVASDGIAALAIMAEEVPALVLLDLVMPGLGGADVLDQMRADLRLRQVPVVILSNKVLNLDDVKRLEHQVRVTFQSKGLWSEAETIAALSRVLFGADTLPVHTSALVKHALAYLHQNYARPLSRWEIAEAVGVSEDYLSRVFNRELGLSPWDYLNRYRILQAKTLLLRTQDNIGAIAQKVGFKDQAYFSRVFHKLTGLSPQMFRDSSTT